MFRRMTGVAVGVALLILAVGCGGGGGDSSTEVTKAEFTKQANAICAERDKKWTAQVASWEKKELSTAKVSASKDEAGELIASELVPLMEDELRKLEALEIPAGEEETISKMWKTRSKAIAEIEADPLGIAESPSLTSFTLQARKYGLDCKL